ncbi:flagellin [Rhodospirillum rubrum]|uniref:Flagellar hook-associated protein 3 FlgL n=1 Tax=Rhodospirillum rubrum (strain ATCC 11170 / ATH 1.1.1 / DSM 467 / LMG 4362 / NCIMB 8255 / S1) TaxID=269796 RepID=Q2RRB7_RHORT|nr:flagellin [Rhodospirillum rubrum]ABC23328.1 putative flagellar hook-associated protein 3 FlgL [Rhodospirillum rubrum ATCC 11170]AEO49061.1 flagellar hook-associated protein FlgL [Rhodospirillum rubrum F11]MBK5954971.1 flagellar biosynthesis protein FlgL [Rhodospirillum rubrum]QXG79301.1 flagellin [Rhodospirillum rubrum]HAQ01278.1 flagellar biosynthesis protein FlgL [Rhodospirillum rubrum]
MRVATSTMSSSLITQALRNQGDYNSALNQQSSGLKDPSLNGLGGLAGTTVSLASDLKRSDHLVTQATTAQSEVEVAYGKVSKIADLVKTAQVAITAAISGDVSKATGLQASAEGWLTDIAAMLNTQVGGTYVFAGAGSVGAPVDLSAYGGASSTDTSYYSGTTTPTQMMVDAEGGIEYGTLANDPAFANTLKALYDIANTNPPTLATLQSASTALSAATTDLGKTLETLSAQSDRLTALVDTQTEFQLFAESALESLTKVDVAEATAKASERSVVLKASFSALSSMISLSLLDYLR